MEKITENEGKEKQQQRTTTATTIPKDNDVSLPMRRQKLSRHYILFLGLVLFGVASIWNSSSVSVEFMTPNVDADAPENFGMATTTVAPPRDSVYTSVASSTVATTNWNVSFAATNVTTIKNKNQSQKSTIASIRMGSDNNSLKETNNNTGNTINSTTTTKRTAAASKSAPFIERLQKESENNVPLLVSDSSTTKNSTVISSPLITDSTNTTKTNTTNTNKNKGSHHSSPINASISSFPSSFSTPSKKPILSTISSSPYAYVFMIWKINPNDPKKAYLPYLANLLIAAKLLRRFGSTQDILVLLQLRHDIAATTLPREDEILLQQQGIKVEYMPKSERMDHPNGYVGMMNKFHVYNLTQYRRVLYLDSDIMPLTNLDYIMELSDTENNHDNTTADDEDDFHLEPTVVIAGPMQPANGGFVVIPPSTTSFLQLQDMIAKWDLWSFNDTIGWGHEILPPDAWETNRPKHNGTFWRFYAANADQGLLYHYPKYVQHRLTQIFSYKIVNYGRMNQTTTTTPSSENANHGTDTNNTVIVGPVRQWKVTNATTSPLAKYSKRFYPFGPTKCNHHTGKRPLGDLWPGCVPPYTDYAHFTGKDKPWKRGPPPRKKVWRQQAPTNDYELWWKTLLELQEQDGIDITKLGFKL